jgi:hypothetical protein
VARGWKLDNAAVPFDQQTLSGLDDYRAWFEQWLPGVLEDSGMRT